MKILFLGDVAIPDQESVDCLDRFLDYNKDLFKDVISVVNIEGMVSEKDHYLERNTPALFNLPSAITTLKQKANLKCACLSNNHTLDLPDQIQETLQCMAQNDIAIAGIQYGNQKKETTRFNVGNQDFIIFNACWKQLLNHQKNPASNGLKVVEIEEEKMIEQVRKSKINNPDCSHLIYLHWNFDLETLPFPAHRHFAMALIDNGADIVVGCHSHCIQPFEIYKGKGIFYNIGNFLIPNNKFANKRLFFPRWASIQYIVEFDTLTFNTNVHVVEYSIEDEVQTLTKKNSIKVDKSYINSHFSYFKDDYLQYFKVNRRKKKFVPIYKHYNDKINVVYNFILKARGLSARYITSLGLRKWQN